MCKKTDLSNCVSGFGLSNLTGIDPNPENSVAAGIVKMKSQQIGCLLRLEPDKKSNVSFAELILYTEFKYFL